MKAKQVLVGLLSVALIAIASDQSMCRFPQPMQTGQKSPSYSFFLSGKNADAQAAMSTGVQDDEQTGQRLLIPGGQSIGLSLSTQGVFVVETAQVILADGKTADPAREAGLTSGDCIHRIDNKPIASMEMLTKAVTESAGSPLMVEYTRDGQKRTATVTPVKDESGILRIGIWVRDSTAGIGTMTYMDPMTMRFGALGHAVTDIDTGRILPIETGEVFEAQIMEVIKGERGEAGELHGVFTGKWDAIQNLTHNTAAGVYGVLAKPQPNPLYPQGLPMAEPEELHTGKATILTTVDANGIREFDCEILRIHPQMTHDARSMVIRITDPDLLAITGGIVQGMSGSPIIQDGKLVGAVTHVCVFG